MLDLVPLAGTRRIMTDRNSQIEVIGELLQMIFPGTVSAAIASAAVRTHQQTPGLRVMSPTKQPPPASQALDRELGGVMRHSQVHETFVPLHVVGPIGDCRADSQLWVIINVHFDRSALRMPRSSSVFEVTDTLFLLGVHRHNRFLARQMLLHLFVDVRIPRYVDQRSELMSITVPRWCRSVVRTEADQFYGCSSER